MMVMADALLKDTAMNACVEFSMCGYSEMRLFLSTSG